MKLSVCLRLSQGRYRVQLVRQCILHLTDLWRSEAKVEELVGQFGGPKRLNKLAQGFRVKPGCILLGGGGATIGDLRSRPWNCCQRRGNTCTITI